MIHEFFGPYIAMLYGAAWNVQQSLEGMNLSSSALAADQIPNIGALVSGWWPNGKVLILLAIFVLASFPLLIFSIIAGYAVNRKRGALTVVVIASLPGLSNILGLWPAVSFVPESFSIGGGGVLGSGLSMLSVLIPCTVLGWSAMILIADIVSPDDEFWHVYDHIWISAALLAGVFFVADSQVSEHQKTLAKTAKEFQEASAYLLHQTTEYDLLCQSQHSKSVSCKWASSVQPILRDYSIASADAKPIPRRVEDLYAIPGSGLRETDVAVVRTELDNYSQSICPRPKIITGHAYYSTPASNKCYSIPTTFCRVSSEYLLQGMRSYSDTQAISNECIVPTLILLLANQEKLQQKIKEDDRSRHYRWTYYVFFSMLIGAKIANSTTKVFLFSRRIGNKDEVRRSLYFISKAWQLSYRFLSMIVKFTIKACIFFFRGSYNPY
jgi:hypothetical protein